MAEPEGTDRRRDLPPGVVAAVVVLVLAPIVALMWVASYASEDPEALGLPVLLLVPVRSGCSWLLRLTWMAYQLVARSARADR